MKFWYRLRKYAVKFRIHQPDTVRADHGSAGFVHRCQHLVFQKGSFMSFFAKTGRNNDKSFYILLISQHIDSFRTRRTGNRHDSHLRVRYIMYGMIRFQTLYIVFPCVDNIQFSFIFTIQKISYQPSTRLVYII